MLLPIWRMFQKKLPTTCYASTCFVALFRLYYKLPSFYWGCRSIFFLFKTKKKKKSLLWMHRLHFLFAMCIKVLNLTWVFILQQVLNNTFIASILLAHLKEMRTTVAFYVLAWQHLYRGGEMASILQMA